MDQEAGSFQSFHRPLTRVAYGPKVSIGPLSGCDVPQRLAPVVTVCPSSPAPERSELAAVSKGSAELQDSCYSSGSEHSSLSRNTSAASETLAQEYGSLAAELSNQLYVGTGDSECTAGSEEYARLLDFSVKLGFTQQQLDLVVNKLAVFPPEQDKLLSELTKLGKQELNLEHALSTDSGQLRTIVIDGSNLAMT